MIQNALEYLDQCLCFSVHGNKGQGIDLSQDQVGFYYRTDGVNRDGTLKHSYPNDKWVLVPLGHSNWKWNQARGNYSTYEQELLAGMLVLSSQSR